MENVALVDANTISKRPSTVTDTPIAGPLMAATRGFGKSMYAETYLLQEVNILVQLFNGLAYIYLTEVSDNTYIFIFTFLQV